MSRCIWLSLALALTAAIHAVAAPPATPEAKAAVIGQPAALVVQPEAVTLSGPLATQQLLVTGRYADGTLRDLTACADLTVETAGVVDLVDGLVLPQQNGSTTLLVKAGTLSVRVPVTVRDFDKPRPVSFRTEFIAALSVGGCNSGACHGTPNGRNGFKLSLRGYDPSADYLQLTRDMLGRRTDPVHPQASLILQKPLGQIPHEGGKRFAATSLPARIIHTWIAEGLRDDADLAALKTVEVLPGSHSLHAPNRWQQLAVLARFADGSVRDVTRLTVFTSSNDGIATVTASGLVEFRQAGEAAILCRYLDEMKSVRFTYLEPKAGFVWSNPPEHNFVDRHVYAKLKLLHIQPAELCSDSAFLRRAYLDLCGTLPTPDEAKKFLADNAADKRAKLIDALLERPEYADFWTLKWLDVLRNSRRALQPEGAKAYRNWMRGHVEKNTPLDRVVRELLTADGNTFTNAPANYFRVARTPQELMETTAQLFCGVRIQCAQCHNHPWERWTQDDYFGMAAFFAQVKRTAGGADAKAKKAGPEVITRDPKGEITHLRTGAVMAPKFLGGPAPAVPADQDRRALLADWLVSADNPFFAKSVVNRVWFHLLGRGIVDPVDDFRDSNPSANDELLEALAKDFVEHQFDVKHLIRTILLSRTYQLSAKSNDFNKDDSKYFSRTVPKLLSAEQLLDALCAVTEVPENFTGMPAGTRAIQLPDGEVNHPFLKTFGQPARQTSCECERNNEGTLARALQLVNGPTVTAKIGSPRNRIARLLGGNPKEMLDELYLAAFSRLPTAEETKAALGYVGKTADKRKAWEDIQWALLNAREFLMRH